MIETEATRVRYGASAATDPAILARLAHDPSVTVRASLALNPAAPAEVDAALARDPDERVRSLLARKLGALVPTLSATKQEALRHSTWALLTRLAEDEADRVRAAIAEEVKHLPDAPRSLILHLAQDPFVTVCEPVILFSPMLTAADLVALVANARSAGTRVAVASRSDLPAPVSDAIAATADGDAIRALLSNQSAQIREATLDALALQAAEHETWHDPLVRRPVLSPQAARALSEIVAGHLLEVLATRTDLGEDFRQRLRRRLAGEGGSALVAAAGASGDPPAAPGTDASAPSATVDAAEERLMQAARTGDTRAAMALLATRAGVAPGLVEQAVTLRSTKALVALTWKAGLAMRVAVAMQTLLAKVAPCAIILPGPGDSYPLAVEEMKWQLDFLATAAAAEPAAKAWFSGGSGSRAPTR
jgi:uncharacterized protein (DUF2336 family)